MRIIYIHVRQTYSAHLVRNQRDYTRPNEMNTHVETPTYKYMRSALTGRHVADGQPNALAQTAFKRILRAQIIINIVSVVKHKFCGY